MTGGGASPNYIQVTTNVRSEPAVKGDPGYAEILANRTATDGALCIDIVTEDPIDQFTIQYATGVTFGAFANPHTIEVEDTFLVTYSDNVIVRGIRGKTPDQQTYTNKQAIQVYNSTDVLILNSEAKFGSDDNVTASNGSNGVYFIDCIVHSPYFSPSGYGFSFTLPSSGWDNVVLLNCILMSGSRCPKLGGGGAGSPNRTVQLVGCVICTDAQPPRVEHAQECDWLDVTLVHRTSYTPTISGDIRAYGTDEADGAAGQLHVSAGCLTILKDGTTRAPVIGYLKSLIDTGSFEMATSGAHTPLLTYPVRTRAEHYDYTLANAGCGDAETDAIITTVQNRNW